MPNLQHSGQEDPNRIETVAEVHNGNGNGEEDNGSQTSLSSSQQRARRETVKKSRTLGKGELTRMRNHMNAALADQRRVPRKTYLREWMKGVRDKMAALRKVNNESGHTLRLHWSLH